MTMTEYETTVVIRPDVAGDTVETTLDRVRDVVRNRGGKLLAINHWGKRKLAYEIQKHSRGVYVHTQYLGNNTLVAELERIMRINDNVLRFMTIRMADFIDPEARQETAYERPAYDAPDEPDAPEGQAADDDQDEDSDSDSDDRGQDGADEPAAAADKED